jgi:hypothetical protein
MQMSTPTIVCAALKNTNQLGYYQWLCQIVRLANTAWIWTMLQWPFELGPSTAAAEVSWQQLLASAAHGLLLLLLPLPPPPPPLDMPATALSGYKPDLAAGVKRPRHC